LSRGGASSGTASPICGRSWRTNSKKHSHEPNPSLPLLRPQSAESAMTHLTLRVTTALTLMAAGGCPQYAANKPQSSPTRRSRPEPCERPMRGRYGRMGRQGCGIGHASVTTGSFVGREE
jgi:hypothetical protein